MPREPYQYSKNPFTNLATASWSTFPIEQEERVYNYDQELKERLQVKQPKAIFVVRTLEPDKNNKGSKKQVSREFLKESDTIQSLPEPLVQRQLEEQLRMQESNDRKKKKKKEYQKKKILQRNELAKPCDFDFQLCQLFKVLKPNANGKQQLDAFTDDYSDLYYGGREKEAEVLGFPEAGNHVLKVSSRDAF